MSSNLKIYLDSSAALQSDPTKCSYTFFFDSHNLADHDNWALTLTQANLINSQYPINSNNNTIVFYENSNDAVAYTATLEEGTYTMDSFATEIGYQMSAVSGNGYDYKADVSSSTYKLTIAADGVHVFRVGSTSTCLDEMGYTTIVLSHDTSITFQSPVHISGTRFVDVVSNIPTNNINTLYNYNILQRIQITVDFGDFLFYEDYLGQETAICRSSDLQKLTIELRDENGDVFDTFANLSNAFTLTLSPIE
jgi:hypothetical protein